MLYIYITIGVVLVCLVLVGIIRWFTTQVWLPDTRGMGESNNNPPQVEQRALSKETIEEINKLHPTKEFTKLYEGDWSNEDEENYIINKKIK